MYAFASWERGNARLDFQHSGQDVRPPGDDRAHGAIRSLWLILCGCLLVAAIFAGTTMMVGEFRERAIANSERELENTVRLLTRHFDQQFDDTEVIAADVIREMQVSRIETADAFREKMSTFDAA